MTHLFPSFPTRRLESDLDIFERLVNLLLDVSVDLACVPVPATWTSTHRAK